MLKPEIVAALFALTHDEVQEAWKVLAQRNNQLRAVKAAAIVASGGLHEGVVVTFKDRQGRTLEGTITKVNRTTATVRMVEQATSQFGLGFIPSYRVSLSMLSLKK